MRAPVYPLYILEKDDFSLREVTSQEGLDWYEWPDIEADLYEGWDSSGRHFSLAWQPGSKTRELLLDEAPTLTKLRQVVIEYAARVGRLASKPWGLCDPAEMLQRVGEIERGTLR